MKGGNSDKYRVSTFFLFFSSSCITRTVLLSWNQILHLIGPLAAQFRCIWIGLSLSRWYFRCITTFTISLNKNIVWSTTHSFKIIDILPFWVSSWNLITNKNTSMFLLTTSHKTQSITSIFPWDLRSIIIICSKSSLLLSWNNKVYTIIKLITIAVNPAITLINIAMDYQTCSNKFLWHKSLSRHQWFPVIFLCHTSKFLKMLSSRIDLFNAVLYVSFDIK